MLTIKLLSQKEQTEFNLRRWNDLVVDPELAKIEGAGWKRIVSVGLFCTQLHPHLMEATNRKLAVCSTSHCKRAEF